MLVLATIGLLANQAIATEPTNQTNGEQSAVSARLTSELSETQRETIAEEANALYQRAVDLEATDSAESKDLFGQAATKYQMLADRTPNSKLNFNLGNAYLKSGDVGRAIASYERARRLDPSNYQISKNLEVAESLIESGEGKKSAQAESGFSLESVAGKLTTWNNWLLSAISQNAMLGILALTSVIFWGILIARSSGIKLRVLRWATVPLLFLIFSASSLSLADFQRQDSFNAIAVAEQIEIRTGDGTQFDVLRTIEPAIGKRLNILTSRNDWHQVQTSDDTTGWVDSADIELLN